MQDSYAVTVGSGGTGGVAGGNTTMAGLVAAGGNPGSQIYGNLAQASNAIALGSPGGGASGGKLINSRGGCAGFAIKLGGTIVNPGGDSVLGSGGRGAGSTDASGEDGSTGGGGGGATSNSGTTFSGGKGGDGILIMWEFS